MDTVSLRPVESDWMNRDYPPDEMLVWSISPGEREKWQQYRGERRRLRPYAIARTYFSRIERMARADLIG